MKFFFYLFSLSFILTNCGNNSKDKIGNCCDNTYTNVDSAIHCFNRTGNDPDNRLLLIAFVDKDLEASQKLGWGIIKDPDIVKIAKRNYALVIVDVNEYQILDKECSYNISEIFKKQKSKTLFIIANQALCVFGKWTLDDDKESIIERLMVGDGP